MGIGVLADGMGGHAAGDAASAIVVTEVLREIALRKNGFLRRMSEVPQSLRAAAVMANGAIETQVAKHPAMRGMGSTLVATVLVGPQLYWASVGDSPLYLHRGRKLTRLNEDHSMAPQIDAMVALGQIRPEVGLCHPDRSCLTSAITGHKIARLHCPAEPFTLQAGDILVLASDGLHSLSDGAVEQILRKSGKRSAIEIAETLIDAVRDLRLEDQDNISVMVIKVLSDKPLADGLHAGRDASERQKARPADQMEAFDAVVIDDEEPETLTLRAVGL